MENLKYKEYLKSLDDNTLNELIDTFSSKMTMDQLRKQLADERQERIVAESKKAKQEEGELRVGKYYMTEIDNVKTYYHIKSYSNETLCYYADSVSITETKTEYGLYTFSKVIKENACYNISLFDEAKEISAPEYDGFLFSTGRVHYHLSSVYGKCLEQYKKFQNSENLAKGKNFLNRVLDDVAKFIEESDEEDC